MKKILLIVACCTLQNIIFAQSKQGIVTYKKQQAEFLFEKESFKTKYEKTNPSFYYDVKMMELETNKLLTQINFILTFNNTASLFKAEEFLEVENYQSLYAALGPDGSTVYYNSEKQRLRQIDCYGEIFLVKYPKFKWELLNETKTIAKHTCYKAVTKELIKTRKGQIERLVVAWYAPEINLPYGPLGFGNLPGLIFELNYLSYRYTITKIDLNQKDEIKIKEPTKGINVTKDEFEAIGRKTMDDLKKGFLK